MNMLTNSPSLWTIHVTADDNETMIALRLNKNQKNPKYIKQCLLENKMTCIWLYKARDFEVICPRVHKDFYFKPIISVHKLFPWG